MTKEAFNYFERMINCGMAILREKDIELGAMDSNFNPVNHLLSAEENKKCWEYLAYQFIMNILNANFDKAVAREENELYGCWLVFLQEVEGIVRYGRKNKGIENIVNSSGIARETFVKFLD